MNDIFSPFFGVCFLYVFIHFSFRNSFLLVFPHTQTQRVSMHVCAACVCEKETDDCKDYGTAVWLITWLFFLLFIREENGGVVKEGFKSAQATFHFALTGGKICCFHEEAAVR